MTDYAEFSRRYDLWADEAREELCEKAARGLWPWTEKAADESEICESGQVHWGGASTGLGWVTPWAESPHFCT